MHSSGGWLRPGARSGLYVGYTRRYVRMYSSLHCALTIYTYSSLKGSRECLLVHVSQFGACVSWSTTASWVCSTCLLAGLLPGLRQPPMYVCWSILVSCRHCSNRATVPLSSSSSAHSPLSTSAAQGGMWWDVVGRGKVGWGAVDVASKVEGKLV